MNTQSSWQETHLMLKEFSLKPGGEWRPTFPGWTLIQISRGQGYWLKEQSRTELEPGMVLLLAGNLPGHFLVSQLNVMSLLTFSVIPDRLSGLIALEEQNHLKQAAARNELAIQFFRTPDPIALKMGELCARPERDGLWFRLAMLQLLVEAFGMELKSTGANGENTDATQRLRLFLSKHPQDALLNISLNELAQIAHCTSRHLSRIFYELVGMSFSDKRSEIKLARARELLATGQSKIVDVALESGYNSLSSFNLVFTRRFGTSPGRWRQINGDKSAKIRRPKSRPKRWVSI